MPDQITTPHFQIIINGTNRYERELPALAPDKVLIDSNNMIDRVYYTLQMSKDYNYFDLTNKATATWHDLLKQNKYFRLTHIYKFDPGTLINEDIPKSILSDNISGPGKAELDAYIKDLSGHLNDIINELADWITWFNPYQEEDFNTFYTHLTITKDEIKLILEVLNEILSNAKKEKPGDTLVEIDDAVNKLRRYFYGVSDLAKNEFYKQLAADESVEPHISLFLSFLDLFNSQRDQLNSLTQKHLDYCYSQLLKLEKNSAVPDKVYVSFKLANNVTPYTLGSGIKLDAGKDENNLPIIFATDEELLVSDTTVGGLKTLFISHLSKFSQQPDENEPGLRLETLQTLLQQEPLIIEDAIKIQIGPGSSGNAQPTDDAVPFTDEDLGLVMASSLFYIEDGHATIDLTLNLNDDAVYKRYQGYLKPRPFSVYITAVSGWRSVDSYTFTPHDNKIVLTLHYNAIASPICSYDPKIHTGNYTIQKPAIRINLRSQKDVSPYIYLLNLVINRIDIHVSVNQHKKIKIQTNAGAVSPGSPFQAFGPNPQPGGYFALRNANIFNRNLSSFNIHLEWMGLPAKPGGFGTYYIPYNQAPYSAGLNDLAFKVDMTGLNGNSYAAISTKPGELPLFALDGRTLLAKSELGVKDVIKGKNRGFDNDASLESEKTQDFSMPGSLRLTFTKPDAGFGFNLFPSVLADAIAKNARKNAFQAIAARFRSNKDQEIQINDSKPSGKSTAASKAQLTLPNQPYIPVIKTISLDYTLNYSVEFDPNKPTKTSDDITLIHINPFGYKTIYPNPDIVQAYFFMPQFLSGNNLFVGFTNLHANAFVNLLFTLDENALENDFATVTPVNWFYLRNNEWIGIDPDDIASDSTNGFTRNGIVKLNIPNDITTNNTVMPPDIAWILATVKEDDLDNNLIRNLSKMIYTVAVNSTSATRQIDKTQPNPGPFILAAGLVKDLVTRVPQIAAITQILPSYGGVSAESSQLYYLRVSERLRHKSRPLSAWELERIILDNFPMLRYVKCVNFKASSWHMPKIEPQPDILVIVVGDEYYSDAASMKIGFTTLSEIKTFLGSVINAKLNIAVSNPHAERLKFKCRILFKNNDWSKVKNLESDFANYINPWVSNPDRKIKINTVIYRPDVLGFLRGLPYVDDIQNLVLIHIFEKSIVEETGIEPVPGSQAERDESTSYMLEETADDTPVKTYLPYGIFIADAPHFLSNLSSDQSEFMGIDEMTINDDFRLEGAKAADLSDTAVNINISDEKLSFIINIV